MKKLFFALPLLLAGCQAERVAFHFQPVAPASKLAPAQELGAGPAATSPSPALPPPAVAHRRPASPAQPRSLARTAGQFARPALSERATRATAPLGFAAGGALATPVAAAHPLASQLIRRPWGRQRATAGPAHAAENGLGGIALFFIAVVLAILAGLGALVSLLPGVSFLGGVGLAAAGLVVLFLLYKLVSGGGKKQKAK